VILDRDLWQGNIFLGAKWSPASGGLKDVIEPATETRWVSMHAGPPTYPF
jgi:hypothetical protein